MMLHTNFYQLKQFKCGGRDTTLWEGKGCVRKRKVGWNRQIKGLVHRLICQLWFHLLSGDRLHSLEKLPISHLLSNIQVLLHNLARLCQKSFTNFWCVDCVNILGIVENSVVGWAQQSGGDDNHQLWHCWAELIKDWMPWMIGDHCLLTVIKVRVIQ